nr:MAG TPA_asm: hypothetical protein [Caudoviricetes sp.]
MKAVFSGCALKHSGENPGRRANSAMQDLKYLHRPISRMAA